MTTNRLSGAQNKQIADWLGICWHENIMDSDFPPHCSCGEPYSYLGRHDNTSFDTRPGFWLIMDHGPKCKDWEKFLDETQIGVSLEPWVFDAQGNDVSCREWAIKQDFVGEKLAVELARFIEGEGK